LVVVQGNLLIDSQAQLNQSAQAAAPPPGVAPAVPAPKFTDAQRTAAREFLAVVGALSAALAADKLDDFNHGAAQLHTAAPALTQALSGTAEWSSAAAQINSVAHLPNAPDLKAARKAFAPLSIATVEFAKRLRLQEDAFATLKIYLCPMTEDAFPGAPKRGTWLQLAPPLRNPYFGTEMLDCGQEIK
jgi:Cu(I)/Ag(I) efflux system membrane fusion protein